MKILYIDCGMGAAGDMLTGALLELLPDKEAFLAKLNALGIPGVEYVAESSVKCGISGTHVRVLVHGQEEHAYTAPAHEHTHEHEHAHEHTQEHTHEYAPHAHHGMYEIEHLVRDHLKLPAGVADSVLAVYALIAEAESRVHNVPVADIHFHEVGTMDAVADITAVCMLMKELDPDEVVVSPVHVGSGQVQCMHGILPVPAPATAHLLLGIPSYGGKINGELCTPTGAALLKHFATRFGEMPVMRIDSVGYGMGQKDFPAANCVRILLGESQDQEDGVVELSCNVDDMSAEAVSFAMDRLFENGALEVYTVPVGMKKSRPGVLIRVLCDPQDKEKVIETIFLHTTTIGIRENPMRRYVLERRIETLQTPYGTVRKKISEGYGVRREKYEHEDLARIAKEQGITLLEVKDLLDGK